MKSPNFVLSVVVLSVVLYCICLQQVLAAPGSLDPTFGSGGIYFYPDSGDYYGEYPRRIESHPDGRFSFIRYEIFGDYCFGDYGDSCDVEVMDDGRYYYFSRVRYPIWRHVVVRQTSTGFDPSFGIEGIQELDPELHPYEVELGPGAKVTILAVDGVGTLAVPVLVRLMPNGTPDITFGTNGMKRLEGTSTHKIRVQADGKIIMDQYAGGTGRRIVRLNANGATDPSFAQIDFGGSTLGEMELDANGRLVATFGTPTGIVVKRFGHEGTVDTGFGNDGQFAAPGKILALQRDGKILLGGQGSVYRFSVNGEPDLSFGVGGRTPIGIGDVYDLEIQGNTRILAAIGYESGGRSMVAVARLINIANPFDFDGDGKADLSVFRPEEGIWYSNGSHLGYAGGVQWGKAGDVLVAGDYDGDGKTDQAIFRNGDWWILKSSGGHYAFRWGMAGDKPVPADYDGDGKTDLAIVRDGVWWINKSSGGYEAVQWGSSTDLPVPADYDGDGKADPAIFRDGVWWFLKSTGGYSAVQWGMGTDKIVYADYDGDGKADPAVVRDGIWWVLKSTGGYSAIQWGNGTDIPVPADYDGDGLADAAILRDSVWWILKSTGGYEASQWGSPTDLAIPANRF